MFCTYAVTFPTFGPCKQRNFSFFFFFNLIFLFCSPFFHPTATPTKLSAHTEEMWHWLGQPDVTLKGYHSWWRKAERGFWCFPSAGVPKKNFPSYLVLPWQSPSWVSFRSVLWLPHSTRTHVALKTVRKLSLEHLSPAVFLFQCSLYRPLFQHQQISHLIEGEHSPCLEKGHQMHLIF